MRNHHLFGGLKLNIPAALTLRMIHDYIQAVKSSIRAVIQDGMSSRRFPGKVLAPFRTRPLIAHPPESVDRILPEIPVAAACRVEPACGPSAALREALDTTMPEEAG